MIQGAVFDVDGTLLDSMAIWDEAAPRYLQTMGIEPDGRLSEILAPMTVDEGAKYIGEKYKIREELGQIARGVLDIVRDFYFFEAPLKRGAVEFLEALSRKGIPMAAATSGDYRLVKAAFQRLGIDGYFQAVLTCSEVGAGKTDPLIYQTAAGRLGSRAEVTCVFEDALYAVRTAGRAGFRTVGVYDEYSEKDREEIEKLSDIYLMDFTETSRFWQLINTF